MAACRSSRSPPAPAAPTDTGGGTITDYTITATPGGQTQTTSGSTTAESMTGLTLGGTYTFTITATSDGGTSVLSAATNPIAIWDAGQPWTAVEAPLPANAAATPLVHLDSVACPTTSFCVAVGNYTDSTGAWQGLLLTEHGSTWTATEAPLPPNAIEPDPGYGGGVWSVACASSTSCAAVGSYDSTSGLGAMILTLAGTSWEVVEAPLPPGGGVEQQLVSVACPSVSSCVAVGSYQNASGNQGLIVTGDGSSWTATTAPQPPNANSASGADLDSVACPSASSCVAVGGYTGPATASILGLLVTGYGSTWTAAEAPLPADALNTEPGFDANLASVACASSTSCTAAGGYDNPTGGQGLLVTGYGSTWTSAKAPLLQGAAPDPDVSLYAVGCQPKSSCVAAGTYTSSDGLQSEGALLTGTGVTWSAASAPFARSASYLAAYQHSIACPAASTCIVAGDAWILTSSGTSWVITETPLPADANAFSPTLDSIACPSETSCLAVGSSYTSNGERGLLITGPG